MSRPRRRIGKPTTAGYVVLAIVAILVATVVVGVIIGGGTGVTVDAVAGFLLVAFILIVFGESGVLQPRLPGDDPRDHFPSEPPGPGSLR